MMSAALIIRTKSYFCQCSTWVFFSPCMTEETGGGTTEQVQQSQTLFDSTKPKNSARDNNQYLSSVFFTFCINLGFLLHHQHSCCCCRSSFCSVGHKLTLGFNKPLASAENRPHKTYCKYKIRYFKKCSSILF